MPSKAGGFFDPLVRGSGSGKRRAGPIVRRGLKPFKHSLKQLSKIPNDKWLLKRITVRYFRKIQFEFTGEISCIGNNGQIRLQYIEWPEMDVTDNYHSDNHINKFHSVWIHYKQIDRIMYENKNVTAEILDILKMKMAQSFVYFYNFQDLDIKMIPKVINAEYTEKYMEDLLATGDGILINSTFQKKIKVFLYDCNRTNRHILLQRNTFKNEQRRLLSWSVIEFGKILHNYKELFTAQILKNLQSGKGKKRMKKPDQNKDKRNWAEIKTKTKTTTDKAKKLIIAGSSEHIDKVYKDFLKPNEETKDEDEEKKIMIEEIDETKKKWPDYMDWDTEEIGIGIKKELERSENKTGLILAKNGNRNCVTKWGKELALNTEVKMVLYNISSWGNILPRPYIRGPRKQRKSRWKWRPEKNKWLSNQIKKKNVNKQTNRYHHGKQHLRVKKLKRKRKRLDVKGEADYQYNSC